jgi:AraC-like DNA-binding protein
VQERLSQAAARDAFTLTCPNGMCETAVPVRLGQRLLGFLQTGQVFRGKPTEAQFERAGRRARDLGVAADPAELRRAYFATKVVSPSQHAAIVGLLAVFADHLSMLSNQALIEQEMAEPELIARSRRYIQEHQTQHLSLSRLARVCGTSPSYFCKLFRKGTGLRFTDYLARVRIEKSRNLLLNPHLRVSEIAFEVGFHSLTHFNRVFRKILGQSPSEYRAQLLGKIYHPTHPPRHGSSPTCRFRPNS